MEYKDKCQHFDPETLEEAMVGISELGSIRTTQWVLPSDPLALVNLLLDSIFLGAMGLPTVCFQTLC